MFLVGFFAPKILVPLCLFCITVQTRFISHDAALVRPLLVRVGFIKKQEVVEGAVPHSDVMVPREGKNIVATYVRLGVNRLL